MSRIIAVANHKGGVGKTSTCLHLSHALAADGKTKVLLVDLDPQASLTHIVLTTNGEKVPPTFYYLLLGLQPPGAAELIQPTRHPGIFLVPATGDLANVEIQLAPRMNRERVLERVLRPLADAFDLVFLDCPPALNLLTMNALAAADEVLIPIESGFLELHALHAFLASTREVQRELNPHLKIGGIVLTKHHGNTSHGRGLLEELRRSFPEVLFQSVIPYSIRAKESVARLESIFSYDPKSAVAEAYRSLAEEVMHHHA